jgi:hypothetical protein
MEVCALLTSWMVEHLTIVFQRLESQSSFVVTMNSCVIYGLSGASGTIAAKYIIFNTPSALPKTGCHSCLWCLTEQ